MMKLIVLFSVYYALMGPLQQHGKGAEPKEEERYKKKCEQIG